MTNINCSSNCQYQIDGKCSYHTIDIGCISPNAECAYFVKKSIPETPEK